MAGSTVSGLRKPSNRVTQEVGVEYFMVGSNATAAKMKPGVAVEADGAGCCKEFDGTGLVIGILGYEDAQTGDNKPATRDTAYAAGVRVPVIPPTGSLGIAVRCRLAASQTIVRGQQLMWTSDGLLTAATVGTHDVSAVAAEDISTGAGDAGTAIWVFLR